MNCGKCLHEFCWFCLGPYYSYTHSENRLCPYRYAAVIGSFISVVFFMNQKLAYTYETVFNVEFFIFYNLAKFGFIKLFFFSCIFYFHVFEELKRARNNFKLYNNYYKSKAEMVFLGVGSIVEFIVHIVILLNINKIAFLYDCLIFLTYEILIALFCLGIFLIALGIRWVYM